MFGHFPELIIVLVIALIFFGPEKLPEVAQTVGKMMGEMRRAVDGVMHPEDTHVPDDFSTYYYDSMVRNGEQPHEPDGELRSSSYVGADESEGELDVPEHGEQALVSQDGSLPTDDLVTDSAVPGSTVTAFAPEPEAPRHADMAQREPPPS